MLLALLLARSTLPFPLGIDLGGEGVLEAQRDLVHKVDPGREHYAGGAAVDERGAQEAHGGAVVHGRVGEIEGKAGDDVIHQDAEVVAQEGAGDAQRPCRRDDQDISSGDQGVAGVRGDVGLEQRVRRLVAQGALVEQVAHDADREDGRGEGVAGRLGAAAEELGKDLVAILYRRVSLLLEHCRQLSELQGRYTDLA